jgi:hypothetical protein
VLAKSTDENLAQFLSQIGEVLKLKIKSNLDKIGAVRDAYDLRLKELQEKGKIFKDIATSIKDRFNFQLGEQRLEAMIQIAEMKNATQEQIAQIKAENKRDGSKLSLEKIAEELEQGSTQSSQVCPPDPNFPNLPDLKCMKEKGLIK